MGMFIFLLRINPEACIGVYFSVKPPPDNLDDYWSEYLALYKALSIYKN